MMAIPRQQVARVVGLPEPDPDRPGPMRLFGEDELAAALAQMGVATA